jgi:hypothetical protein
MPLTPSRDPVSGIVKYPEGRIMAIGGGGDEGEPDPKIFSEEPYGLKRATPASKTAEILDYAQPDQWGFPTWRQTHAMTFARVMPDAVLLPDGKILVVGGAQKGRSGGFLIHFGESWGADDPALEPEIFDPTEEIWETMCKKPLRRLYHATAALLPDGRVVVAGHDGYLNHPMGGSSVYELEIFSPPYLHRGPRPKVYNAPTSVAYMGVFTIEVDATSDIASVALIRQSSITHQTNTDQRYVGLAIIPTGDPKRLSLHSPPHGGVAPPGFYMLFALNHAGVPSEAKWIRVG